MTISPSRPAQKRSMFLGAAAVSALVLSACGTSSASDDTDQSAGSSGLDTINVGYFPLVHTSTIVHADQAGYLEDAGIDAELMQTEGGAAAIPSLISGDVDILYSNYTSILLAAEQGLPVALVSGNDVAKDDHGIFVAEDSDIEEFADIEGKSFAVNNLQNIGTVSVYAQLEDLGLSPDSVDLVEMPNPDMAPAVANGSVDVIWQVEPFQTISQQSGLKRIGDMFAGPAADMPVGGWVTTREFAEQNPDVLAAFQDALAKSSEDLQGNHELHLELVPQYTEIDESVAQELTLPHYDTELNVDALQYGADLMEKYGITSGPLKVSDLVVE
ncbi:ABC transporter substrate-binding protein [Enteractinococcus coprophilus]|uniref:NitT/TauT family transport system substrate-binding protein n=1 Tax=Enteractinococcus coprophilus TaxID=1027633 RepID=A0A543AN43_9MICC|nr:ABC transporter substrate-binding protein [Enteractinococcus coprophilus]TQL74004.1 NitT/TauT family transport system substrate-binding protein [Enteractinococcus coprophilus]